MTHRTRVIGGSKNIVLATCTCGWVSEDRRTLTEARKDANDHEIEKLKADRAQGKLELKDRP